MAIHVVWKKKLDNRLLNMDDNVENFKLAPMLKAGDRERDSRPRPWIKHNISFFFLYMFLWVLLHSVAFFTTTLVKSSFLRCVLGYVLIVSQKHCMRKQKGKKKEVPRKEENFNSR